MESCSALIGLRHVVALPVLVRSLVAVAGLVKNAMLSSIAGDTLVVDQLLRVTVSTASNEPSR